MEFVVYCPEFDERTGGCFALHLLCHLLNKSGNKAYMHPWFFHGEISAIDYENPYNEARESSRTLNSGSVYRINPRWNTPIYNGCTADIRTRNDVVVIYPEVIFGNPLKAKHVARWLLHRPGFHTRQIYYTFGEVQFPYSQSFAPIVQPGLEVAPFCLNVLEVPWELFLRKESEVSIQRSGSAYAVRKGKGAVLQHESADSICIDDLSLAEVSEIFKRVKTFVSYDPATFYSTLAALSGCDSVVIPESNASFSFWAGLPDPERYGVALGFQDLEWARETRCLVEGALREK
jgi:hypothetical protein